MTDLLSGVALITGAASGIGRATAFSFASHGVRQLALIDVNKSLLESVAAELHKEYPQSETLLLNVDISKEESVVGGISTIVGKFGRIDYAVNNAAVPGVMGSDLKSSLSEFKVPIEVNVFGTWLGMREQIKVMLKQSPLPSSRGRRNRGVIVNTSSILGLVGTSAQMPAIAYSTSKHAIMGLTKSEASIYIKENIRINAMCPGLVSTPIISHNGVEVRPAQLEMQKSPIGRFGQPDEIAEAISFLASEMSSYMSGAGLIVDGGHTSQL